MKDKIEIPEYVKVSHLGLESNKIKRTVSSEIMVNGEYGECWLFIDDKKIAVVNGKKIMGVWTEYGSQIILFQDVESIDQYQLVTSNQWIITCQDGNEKLLCNATFDQSEQIEKFITAVEDLRVGRDINDISIDVDSPNKSKKILKKIQERHDTRKEKKNERNSNYQLFIKTLNYMLAFKKNLFIIGIILVYNMIFGLIMPYYTGTLLYDKVLSPGGSFFGMVGYYVLGLAGITLVSSFVNLINSRVTCRMTVEMVHKIKGQVFEAIQKMSLGYFSNQQTANLLKSVIDDSENLQDFLQNQIPQAIIKTSTLVFTIAILVSMNWRLALITLIPIPIFSIITKKIYPIEWRYDAGIYTKSARFNDMVNDSLNGIRTIRAYGREAYETKALKKANCDYLEVSLKKEMIMSTINPVVGLIIGYASFCIWLYGGWQVTLSMLTFGELMTFITYAGMLNEPLGFITNLSGRFSSAMYAASKIFQIIEANPEIVDLEDAIELTEVRGDVVLENVSFSYEPHKPVLQNISLKIQAGTMLGIVGRSGAGKSTLINLIDRLYNVEHGCISIDGIDIKKIKLSHLHRQIGLVLQETYLFKGTIADNIGYAKPSAGLDEIIESAKIANAHDFIMELPDGYNTIVGTSGRALSGGECQRIAIARAILLDPAILILDEATASLDVITETIVQEALERLIQGRTIISIAHRLSTLRNADALAVIEQGKLVEYGTHEKLLKEKGIYYQLNKNQMEALELQGILNDE